MKLEDLLSHPRLQALRDKGQLDDKKLSFGIILILILLVCADFAFPIKGQFNALKVTEPKIVKLKGDLDAFEQGIGIMQKAKGQQTVPPAAQLKQFISEDQIHSLYQDISEMAFNNNVRIVLMRPSREGVLSKQEKEVMGEKLTSFSLALDLECEYQNLVSFVRSLEQAKTFLVVQNVKILPQAEEILKQKVDLVLKTYLEK
jgi:Tfp pilus assembly protein PilO